MVSAWLFGLPKSLRVTTCSMLDALQATELDPAAAVIINSAADPATISWQRQR